MKPSGFYRTTFGDVRIWCSKLTTNRGRTLVVHEVSGGTGNVVQDTGPETLIASGSLLFDYMNGDTLSPKERLEEFFALVGTEQVLTHPTLGSYRARIGKFSDAVDESGTLSVDCEFIATQDVLDVIPAGAASIPASGEGAVDAASEALEDEIAELGLVDDGLAASASTTVDAWAASDNLNPRDVTASTGTLTQKIGSKMSTLETDLAYWELFKRYALLADSVYAAGKAATQDVSVTYAFRVGAATALRSLVASEYGAENADYYYDQVMKINDIATPGLIPEGETITLPQKAAVFRNG